jgi:hypothetical protein
MAKKKAPTTAVGKYYDQRAGKEASQAGKELAKGAAKTAGGLALDVLAIGSARRGEPVSTGVNILTGNSLMRSAGKNLDAAVQHADQAKHERARGRVIEDLARRGRKSQDNGAPQSWNDPGTPRNAPNQQFAEANAHFEASHQIGPNAGGGVADGGKGWANPTVQAAAQAARGRQFKGA